MDVQVELKPEVEWAGSGETVPAGEGLGHYVGDRAGTVAQLCRPSHPPPPVFFS